MKLKFVYTPESELSHLKWAIDNADRHKKFKLWANLPAGYEKFDLAAVKSYATSNMEYEKATKIEKLIILFWQNNKTEIVSYFNNLPYDKPDEIRVDLTNYGVGGLYWPPNKIILNLNSKGVFGSVIHETTHCIIEKPVVETFNLDHQTKEGLLIWIMNNDRYLRLLFPQYKYSKGYSEPPSKELLKRIGWDKLAN